MIRINTNEGCLLSLSDSRKYIEYVLKINFGDISEFLLCEEVKEYSYWGDIELLVKEEEYQLWILNIAKDVLKE